MLANRFLIFFLGNWLRIFLSLNIPQSCNSSALISCVQIDLLRGHLGIFIKQLIKIIKTETSRFKLGSKKILKGPIPSGTNKIKPGT